MGREAGGRRALCAAGTLSLEAAAVLVTARAVAVAMVVEVEVAAVQEVLRLALAHHRVRSHTADHAELLDQHAADALRPARGAGRRIMRC